MLTHQKNVLLIPITHTNPFTITNFKKVDLQLTDVYDFIQALTSDSTPETFRLFEHVDNEFQQKNGQLINTQTIFTHLYTKNFKYRFVIEKISLALFDSGIGFFNLHIRYLDYTVLDACYTAEEMDLSFLTSLNYSLKRVMQQKQGILAADDIFDFKLFIQHFLDRLGLHYHYLNGEHTLLYTSVHINNPSTSVELAREYTYRLAYNYKYTYLLDKERYCAKSDAMYQPFENVIWCVGHEGLSNITIETTQPETNYFFNQPHQRNLQSIYFYLYLLALYQKYSLLNYTSKNNHLLVLMNDYSIKQRLKYVQQIRKDVLKFTMKGLFHNVSFNSHHAELYKMIRHKLDTKQLQKELNEELLSINQLIEGYVHEEEAIKQKQNADQLNKQMLTMQILTFLVLPLTIFTSIASLDINPIDKYIDKYPIATFGSTCAIFICLYVILKFYYVRKK